MTAIQPRADTADRELCQVTAASLVCLIAATSSLYYSTHAYQSSTRATGDYSTAVSAHAARLSRENVTKPEAVTCLSTPPVSQTLRHEIMPLIMCVRQWRTLTGANAAAVMPSIESISRHGASQSHVT